MVLGQKIDDLHHETARCNFRVVIIKPNEVEQLDLTEPDQAKRWKYTYVGAAGPDEKQPDSAQSTISREWKKEELWP